MRPLTQHEKRTVRFGAAALAVYLLVFTGLQGRTYFGQKRAEYLQLVHEAQTLDQEIKRYQTKCLATQKLMEAFKLDPARLSRPAVVAQASAAIQKAALGVGVMVGPVRELPARPANRELASLQLEALGPPPALLKFLHEAESLGFPLIIDSLQIGAEQNRAGSPGGPGPQGVRAPPGLSGPGGMPAMPGMPPAPIKLSLTIVILDFDLWKEAIHV